VEREDGRGLKDPSPIRNYYNILLHIVYYDYEGRVYDHHHLQRPKGEVAVSKIAPPPELRRSDREDAGERGDEGCLKPARPASVGTAPTRMTV
jgi:hypothetical protein